MRLEAPWAMATCSFGSLTVVTVLQSIVGRPSERWVVQTESRKASVRLHSSAAAAGAYRSGLV